MSVNSSPEGLYVSRPGGQARGAMCCCQANKKKLTEAHRGYVSWPEWLSPRGCVLLAVEIDRSPQGLRILASVAEPEGLCVKASAAKGLCVMARMAEPIGAMCQAHVRGYVCHGQCGQAHGGCIRWPGCPSHGGAVCAGQLRRWVSHSV